MNKPSERKRATGLIFSNDNVGISKAVKILSNRGIDVLAVNTLEKFLEHGRSFPPDLIIVEDDITSNSGLQAIRDLLKVSWTVSSILVSKLQEEEIHDRAEGLGILGSLPSLDDSDKLQSLLDAFERLRIP